MPCIIFTISLNEFTLDSSMCPDCTCGLVDTVGFPPTNSPSANFCGIAFSGNSTTLMLPIGVPSTWIAPSALI